MVDLANPFFKDFDKLFIGWDDTYNKLTKLHDDVTKNIPNYPPYNIKQVEDNHYVIELALAGFAKQDIDVVFEEGKLTVSGKAVNLPSSKTTSMSCFAKPAKASSMT